MKHTHTHSLSFHDPHYLFTHSFILLIIECVRPLAIVESAVIVTCRLYERGHYGQLSLITTRNKVQSKWVYQCVSSVLSISNLLSIKKV